jgi:peptidoglycan hydrolase-like protein with peptidoglycan-binding domain
MLLRKGDKGELVQALQEALLALGYHPGPIDGHFGGLTEEALEKFQKSAKISVDGICGRTTFGEINEALVSQGAEALDLPEENNTDPEPAGKMLSWVACEADKVPNRGGYTRVTLRSDAAESYRALREEVLALGGVLTSAGGRRGLTSKAGASRSRKSMHYTGLALDLALPTGMQNPNTDPYLIQMEDDRYWRVWCKTDSEAVPEVTIKAAYVTRSKGKTVIKFKEVTCRAFDLTAIFTKHGWDRIRARRSFFRGGSYSGAEWWHFQYEGALTAGKSTFGEELLKVYSLSQAKKFVYWEESKNCVFGKNWF